MAHDPEQGNDDAVDDAAEATGSMAVGALDPYKVRGLNTADASGGDNPTGVLGRATGSGQTYGVQGFVDGGAASGASGVYGHTADPAAYGVTATQESATAGAEAMHVSATASSAAVTSLRVDTPSTSGGAVSLYSTAASGKAIVGESDSYYGVEGVHKDATGDDPGVYGRSLSDDTGAVGVEGYVSPGPNRGYGVLGTSRMTGTDAAGVRGESPDGSGQIHGVYGTTGSVDAGAAGVKGAATNASGSAYGVYGSAGSTSGYGVYSDGDAKVAGDADVDNAVTAGSVSTSGNVSAGGSVSAGGVVEVGAYQQISQLGATAFLDQTTSVGNNNKIIVPYNRTSTDDRDEFDTDGHFFNVATPGDYHVTASVLWGTEAFGTYGDEFDLYIAINSTGNYRAKQLGLRGRSGQISKTLRDLNEGEDIGILVRQQTGASVNLLGDQYGTFVTVDKVG